MPDFAIPNPTRERRSLTREAAMRFYSGKHQPLCAMNLATAFVASAEKHFHQPAVFWGDEEFLYGDLLAQSLALARRLRDGFHVKPGDRVAVWLKNCPQFPSVLFGIWQAGGVVVMINHFLKPDEISYILQDSGAMVVISESAFGEAQAKLTAGISQLCFLLIEDLPSTDVKSSFVPALRTGSDLAALLYTSGTTGRPKGAMLTHGNFLHNVSSCLRCLEVKDTDRFIVLLPQF